MSNEAWVCLVLFGNGVRSAMQSRIGPLISC